MSWPRLIGLALGILRKMPVEPTCLSFPLDPQLFLHLLAGSKLGILFPPLLLVSFQRPLPSAGNDQLLNQ